MLDAIKYFEFFPGRFWFEFESVDVITKRLIIILWRIRGYQIISFSFEFITGWRYFF